MTDNTYSGTLKFKDVDFVFVFDGSEVVLIPPKERKNDIMWGWLKKEICPGVYTSGDPLTVDVPYLDGFFEIVNTKSEASYCKVISFRKN